VDRSGLVDLVDRLDLVNLEDLLVLVNLEVLIHLEVHLEACLDQLLKTEVPEIKEQDLLENKV
jgi:hypothetical protein